MGAPQAARAQGIINGFMQGQARASVSASYSFETFDAFYRGRELGDPPAALGSITTQSVNLFVAAGLTDYLDILVNLPFIWASGDGESPPPDQSSIQDLSIYAKLRPLHVNTRLLGPGAFSVLLGAGLQIPIVDYEADAPVSVGTESTNLDSRVVVQYRWDLGIFASAQTGFTWRTTEAPELVPVVVSAGYGGRYFFGQVFFEHQESLRGTDIGPGISFPSNGVSFSRVGVDGYVPIAWGLGISAGFAGILDGRNIGRAIRVSGGLNFSRQF